MADGLLTIDLGAVANNWRALDGMSAPNVETGAVVKADAYGLGLAQVSSALAKAGARTFFVALASEGAELRKALGPDLPIYVFSGYMDGDKSIYQDANLIPLLNSPEQIARFLDDLPEHDCGLQLDTGMNRLGIELVDIPALMLQLPRLNPKLTISHLACADVPDHLLNGTQLAAFITMTAAIPGRKSLAATGGTLLGANYHFDLTRPGVGLYGGSPFDKAEPVVTIDLPVIQTRDVLPAEIVGYGGAWIANKISKIATISAGYADGLIRKIDGAKVYAGHTACPIVGRISMDLITVDVTHLDEIPNHLTIVGPHQTIDDLAGCADTIGYEILTSLGRRYQRRYTGA